MGCEKKLIYRLGRNPDKKDFMTRATVFITVISGQNRYPPRISSRSYLGRSQIMDTKINLSSIKLNGELKMFY